MGGFAPFLIACHVIEFFILCYRMMKNLILIWYRVGVLVILCYDIIRACE